MAESASTRQQGWEWKAAKWALKHPGASSVPVAIGTGLIEFGPQTMGIGAAAAAVGALGWYRGHPATWDRFIAPHLRSLRRRWLSKAYCGKGWLNNIAACHLMQHDAGGHPIPPRVVRIRSHSPSCETVWVRLPKGQTLDAWKDAREALTMALAAERITIEMVSRKKRLIALIVQRMDPFEAMIPAPAVSTNADAVDLADIYIGITEYSSDWMLSLIGQHLLISGTLGSGKSGVLWMLLRAVAPLVRDGIVRLWVADPKEIELPKLAPVSHRYATGEEDIRTLITDYKAAMQDRKKVLAEQGVRKFTPSRETPFDLLIIDELAAVTAYGGSPKELRNVERDMSLIMSQGRALGCTVIGCVQEPTKDVVGMRELFTTKIQMRATSSQHPDMVLGEEMRIRGALADEIPNLPSTAGIGYVVKERTRTPLNVRSCYVDDNAIDEIVAVAGWPMTELNDTQPSTTESTQEVTEDADN